MHKDRFANVLGKAIRNLGRVNEPMLAQDKEEDVQDVQDDQVDQAADPDKQEKPTPAFVVNRDIFISPVKTRQQAKSDCSASVSQRSRTIKKPVHDYRREIVVNAKYLRTK